MTAWLRAMTYNVRYDNPEDGEHRWANRREAVTSTIRFHAPDIVGLQEPLDHQLADVADRLPDFEWLGCGRIDGESEGEHTPIGYRTDRIECADSDTFWLSETPDEPGTVGWDARHPRIVTWARLRDRRTDASLLFANTHFSHDGPRARRKSAHLLLDRLTDLREDELVILTGDFNCVAGEEPYEILTDDDHTLDLAGERDRSSESAHGPPTSVTDFENLVPNRKIDHVFTTPDVTVGHHGVCSDIYDDGRFPSDHLPVLAELDPGEG